METLIGSIERIVFESSQNDFKVFKLRRKDRANFTVTGDFPNLISGAKIEVHGNFQTHPKYGTGFRCEAHSFDYEHNTKSIYLYLQSIAKWIGPERSLAIAKHFKNELEEVIENQPERLCEVEGIGEKIAASIAEAWDLNKNLKNVRIFLHGLGLTKNKIKRIVTEYGPETENILKDNPWLLSFKGFGFTTCDYIANKLEKDMRCAERFRFYALHALKESLRSGHLYLLPRELIASYNKYNGKTPHTFKDTEIDVNDVAPYIKYLKEEGYIVLDSNRIYEVSNFFYESESARLMKKVLDTESSCKLAHQDPEEFIKRYEAKEGIKLAETQKDAIESFIKEKIMIITGSPGTGKTTLIKALVQLLKENNTTFELLTPTGIAAKKLGKTTGCEAYTIHRRLGYRGSEWRHNAMEKYNTQVVIVDETSMVDMEVFYRLISALHSNTKLVFVGDNDQLPSVGPGSVLRDLIKSDCIKSIFLKVIFRQDECSDIIKESKKIRDGDIDLSLFKHDSKADIWHIPCQDPSQIEGTIVKFSNMIKEKNKSLSSKDKKYFQIITPRNQGPCSVDSLNKALQEALNPADDNKKELRMKYMTIRKGDRIIIKKNNYDLDIYNGDIGKVAFITPERVTVDIEDFGDTSKRVEIPIMYVEDMIKLAYSITIHKAQGMEYPLVIIPFIKAHGALLLQRNLLYTALTRAKKKVIIIGQASAIEKAILNNKIQKRNTLFSERLNEWIKGEGISLHDMFSNPEDYQNSKILNQLLSLEATV